VWQAGFFQAEKNQGGKGKTRLALWQESSLQPWLGLKSVYNLKKYI
jgi:hypothetical protein